MTKRMKTALAGFIVLSAAIGSADFATGTVFGGDDDGKHV
jgi:hypothetical protein